jgi:hypothetical protein
MGWVGQGFRPGEAPRVGTEGPEPQSEAAKPQGLLTRQRKGTDGRQPCGCVVRVVAPASRCECQPFNTRTLTQATSRSQLAHDEGQEAKLAKARNAVGGCLMFVSWLVAVVVAVVINSQAIAGLQSPLRSRYRPGPFIADSSVGTTGAGLCVSSCVRSLMGGGARRCGPSGCCRVFACVCGA